jgi:hypothetical protein
MRRGEYDRVHTGIGEQLFVAVDRGTPCMPQKSSALARVRVWARTKRSCALLPCTDATSERPQRPSPTIAARIMSAWFALQMGRSYRLSFGTTRMRSGY